MWHSGFGRSLRNLEFALRNYAVPGYKKQSVRTMVTTGSILSKSRYEMLKEARKLDVHYLLFIDSDQTFPRNTAHMLISRKLDVVGANIAIKKYPSQPTARNRAEPGSNKPVPVYTDETSTGVEEVWRIGTGVLMLSRKVIKALPNNCFEMRYVPHLDDYQGEDWSLMQAIEELGFKIYIDHDLSKQVGHLGTFEFNHSIVGEKVEQVKESQDVGDSLARETTPSEAIG